MRIFKNLFPFSLAAYLKVFACYVAVFAAIYISLFLFSSYTGRASLSFSKEQAEWYVVFFSLILFFLAAAVFFIFNLAASFAYSLAAKLKFRFKLLWKFMLASLFLALIFFIPWLFSTRLTSEKNPISMAVFIIVFLATLHFSNLAYLFTALEGKTIEGIKKGFSFGTAGIRKLIVPYIAVLVALLIFSLIMNLLKSFDFANLVLSGVLMSWMALFVGRIVIKRQKERR